MAPDGQRHELDRRGATSGCCDQFEQLGRRGLSGAGRRLAATSTASHDDAVVGDEAELTFAGFVVFVDPPKADAAAAIRSLAAAGVAVKILTGDNERITRHICSEIGVPVQRRADGERARAHGRGGAAGPAAIGQPVLPGHAAAEGAHPAGPEARRAAWWGSSATASTTPPRCMQPTSASRSTAPPTSPRRPPIWCCWSTISAWFSMA